MFVLSEDGKWYRVSLRLMGDGLPVEKVETMLEIKPSSLGVKGRLIDASEKYRTNIWTLKSGTGSDVPFDEQITVLLDLLESKLDALKTILAMPNVEGQLFLGSNNVQGEAQLSRKLLKRITDLGLSIDLDLYPPSGNDSEN
ncbi:MAG TPA: DUF4279 domain-containing protein [Sphingobacteriaceae bacterium]